MLHESKDFHCRHLPGAQGHLSTAPEDVAQPVVVGIAKCEFLPLYHFLSIEDGVENL